jgi:hypothetical protein
MASLWSGVDKLDGHDFFDLPDHGRDSPSKPTGLVEVIPERLPPVA